jgi:hypothetical protein
MDPPTAEGNFCDNSNCPVKPQQYPESVAEVINSITGDGVIQSLIEIFHIQNTL